MEEAPILPEVKSPPQAEPTPEVPEKAAEWLLHHQELPPEVPPPIYERIPEIKPRTEKDLASKPETYFDRRRETLDGQQPEPIASRMVPLKEVLARHPTNPQNPQSQQAFADNTQATSPLSALGNIRSIVTSPTYRQPMIIGASGGLTVLLMLLILEIL